MEKLNYRTASRQDVWSSHATKCTDKFSQSNIIAIIKNTDDKAVMLMTYFCLIKSKILVPSICFHPHSKWISSPISVCGHHCCKVGVNKWDFETTFPPLPVRILESFRLSLSSVSRTPFPCSLLSSSIHKWIGKFSLPDEG